MFLLIRTGPEGVEIARTISAKVPDGFVGPGQAAFVVVALDFQAGYSDHPQLFETLHPNRSDLLDLNTPKAY